MAKRSKNGMVDPYVSKRVGDSQRKPHRQTVLPINPKGIKDIAKTSKTLSEINKEYAEKERSLSSSAGPHSLAEPHYPKSFFIKKQEGFLRPEIAQWLALAFIVISFTAANLAMLFLGDR
jgi:hypothetical protein